MLATMCGRYATYGPVSVSREARDALDRLELDLISEINQRDDTLQHRTDPACARGHGGRRRAARRPSSMGTHPLMGEGHEHRRKADQCTP